MISAKEAVERVDLLTRSGCCCGRCCITAEGDDLPAGADDCPIQVRNPPVRTDDCPVGVRNPAVGTDDYFVGVGYPPVGSDNCPVRSDNSGTRVNERTIRVVNLAATASYCTAGNGGSLDIGINACSTGRDDIAIKGGVRVEVPINLRKSR